MSALSKVPSELTKEELTRLLSTIDGLPLCCGQYDKGKIVATNGETSAYLDDGRFEVKGISETVRSSKCELIGLYLKNLREIYRHWSKRSIGSPGLNANGKVKCRNYEEPQRRKF